MKRIIVLVPIIALVLLGIYNVGGNKSKSPDPKTISAGPTVKGIQGQEPTVGLEKGNLAPDFELQSVDGKTIKLSSLRGKKVILNFWASWCPPCRLEMPEMEKFSTQNKSKGIEILSVNLTKAERNRDDVTTFMKTDSITFPVLLDEKGDAAQLYNISSIPASFVIDTQGVIRQTIVGPMTMETMGTMVKAIN
ncbi:Peroxiredoxin [Desulfosporosinus acidiphilus SJ4]|uniref:Peroxiredoxin n=1 Tax=Desulfosporosinus acidiphilus (strain DSM 22704 / JCM 16185 / SJ4) TaxID=646529 RepID=I4D5S1_DESAJ|nr:TlpA family protein disulfide reductase [Desulfosporosinus acidiphilus]AFM41145.1 Peroxiredoxin [Desulfosporosinus acidiphilus SJ4]